MNHILNVRQLVKCLVTSRLTGHACSFQNSSTILNINGSPHHDNAKGAQEEEEPFAEGSEGEDQLRKQILDSALPFVHSSGWSQDAVAQGAECLGYSGMAHGMFPKGGVELVNHFYAKCNEKLQDLLEKEVTLIKEQPELKKGTTAFIAGAVEERLRMNVEYIDMWHKALALHASPLNVGNAFKNVTTLVDHIWYYAGDRSTDFNWYTKRGLLLAVYKSTEIFMLQDKSEDFQDTWSFMNRRLSDVHSVGKCARSAGNFAENFGDISKAGFFTALNILGMNNRSR